MSTQLSRRNLLKTLAAGATAAALPLWVQAAAAARPNIVFILADDMGYGDPQCYNPDSKAPTPHIDRLSREGMRFTDAHSPSAVCTPTRYGVLTGRYCWRTKLKKGVLGGYSPRLIEPGRMTVASMLRNAGYATACIGKWHLGFDWARKDVNKPVGPANVDYTKPLTNGPTAVGFDYYFGISASLDMPPYIWIENDRTIGLPTDKGTAAEFLRAGDREPGFRAADVLPTLASRASRFISEQAKSGRPFFLYLPLNSPHTPVAPSESAKGRSKAGPYGDFVTETDAAVGTVLRALDEHGLAGNTLIIFTSDNGSTLQPMTEFNHRPNGNLRGRKSTIWEGGHRVPFVARWPGKVKADSTCAEPVCLADFMATCAAIIGADLPENAAEDSFSILPLLLGQSFTHVDRVVVHHSIEGMFAIRQGNWKLVLGRGSGGWEGKGKPADPEGQLYNMQDDPAESRNLYSSEPLVVARLTALLKKYEATGRSR